MLLRRLAENEDIISRSYEEVAEAIRQGHAAGAGGAMAGRELHVH